MHCFFPTLFILAAKVNSLESGSEKLTSVLGTTNFIVGATSRMGLNQGPLTAFDVNSCLPILYEYCQMTLRQMLQPELTLYEYQVECVSTMPRQEVKKVVAVRYPSPDGPRAGQYPP